MHNHGTRVDTRLHRSTIVELEDDRACADEGGYPPGYGWRENQGRYIHDVPKQKKVPRPQRGLWLSLLWPVGVVALIGLAAVLLP